MTLKWYRVQQDGTPTFLHEGEDVDDSPGLEALQEAVGGYIERIPDFFLQQKHRLSFEMDGKEVVGTLAQVFCNEESKLPLMAITERVQAQQYIEDNTNPLSLIMTPHDFILGDVVAVFSDVEQFCIACENLDEDHPDWMKGMCEDCYATWASAWNNSKTHTPSDEQED